VEAEQQQKRRSPRLAAAAAAAQPPELTLDGGAGGEDLSPQQYRDKLEITVDCGQSGIVVPDPVQAFRYTDTAIYSSAQTPVHVLGGARG
jgi:hypothetical protein